VASVFDVGSEKLTVVTGEPLDKDLIADIAANLGEITVYSAGIMLDETHPNYRNPNAPNQHGFETRLFDEREKAKEAALFGKGKLVPLREVRFSIQRSPWDRSPTLRT